MSERFNEVKELNVSGLDAWVRKPQMLCICTGDGCANLNIEDVRVLRDWLNRALPDSAEGSHT